MPGPLSSTTSTARVPCAPTDHPDRPVRRRRTGRRCRAASRRAGRASPVRRRSRPGRRRRGRPRASALGRPRRPRTGRHTCRPRRRGRPARSAVAAVRSRTGPARADPRRCASGGGSRGRRARASPRSASASGGDARASSISASITVNGVRSSCDSVGGELEQPAPGQLDRRHRPHADDEDADEDRSEQHRADHQLAGEHDLLDVATARRGSGRRPASRCETPPPPAGTSRRGSERSPAHRRPPRRRPARRPAAAGWPR